MSARRRATEAFTRRFNRPPDHVVAAPGRVELLGNHTDYNDGLVLAAAIDRSLVLAVGAHDDARVRIASLEEDAEACFDPRNLAPAELAAWARYPAGVMALLVRRGVAVPGFDAVVASDVPAGAGLSSSAAFEVATALAIGALAPFRLAAAGGAALDDAERWELARLCRAAEDEFAGVPCGLLDQVSVLAGAPDSALMLDCRTGSVVRVPLRDAALVVCDSGERRALAQSGYAELRAACAAAARSLGVAALRDVCQADMGRVAAVLGDREAACARHVVDEIERVARAATALGAGDLTALGRLMTESHASSRTLLGNSTPMLDQLVELALGIPGCLGARLTGAGFGGAIVSLVAADAGDAVVRELPARFQERTGRPVTTWRLRPAGGAV